MIKYQNLFEVKFFHKFYEGHTSKDFDIFLSLGTRATLSSYSLIFRQTLEGFIVLYKDDKQHLLEKLRNEVSLIFGIKSKNRHFETFSNLVPSNSSKKYFFTNKKNVKRDSGGLFTLHPDDFVNNKNLFLYCIDNYNLKESFLAEELLIEKDGNALFDGKVEGWENCSGILGNNYGSYDVTLKDSNETFQVNYLHDSLSNTIAVVEISIGGTESTSFDMMKGNEYHIRFGNRSVLWSYYFISESGKFYELADLFSGKEKLSFSKPELVTLVNGQKATKVTSLQVRPLQQRYNGRQLFVELQEDSNESTKEAKKKVNLPTPDVTRIKGTKDSESETYFSEMYIYL